jgi:anti-sigma factor ChrR (cupin superfamily)
MANLTLTIDADLLKRARMRALERDTSVNALVREYLETLAGPTKKREALDEFLALAEQREAGSGQAGRTWTRDELHER